MSSTRALLEGDGVGRLEPTGLALRLPRSPEDRAPGPLQASTSAPLAESHVIGPFAIRLGVDTGAREATVSVAVENRGDAPARLDAVVLGFRWRDHGLGSFRFLRHGWQSWSVTDARELCDGGEPPFPSGAWLRGMLHARGEVPADRRGWHESDVLTVAGAASRGPACAAGVLEEGQSFGVVYLRRAGDELLVEVELVLEAVLPPGQRRCLDPVHVSLGDDANALLERCAEAHGRSAGARTGAGFQAGWCSWYHFFHEVSEADVLRNLEGLAAARDELPVELVQLDDGYQRAVGDWLETNEKFPRGLAPVAAAIRAAGFRAGLWTAPLLVAPQSRLYAEQPDWLLREGGAPFRGMLHFVWNPDGGGIAVLDTTRQKVLAHLARLFAELTAMGFGYQKLDFLFAAAMQAEAHDPAVSRAARLRRGLLAIRKGCGDDVFLLGCGCPLGPAVGVVDGMRIGPDVAPAWEVAPPVVPIAGIERTQPSTRSAVRSIYKRAFLHRRLWLNDPDCLMARASDTALTRAEASTLAAAIAVTGGIAVFSDDVPALGAGGRALVRETIALARDVDAQGPAGRARCLGLLEQEIASGARAAVEGGALVALLNAGDESGERRLSLRENGVTASGAKASRRLDGGAELRVRGGELRVALSPHETALLHLRGAPPLAVFCDFDGTFAVQDVGATLARRYAGDRRGTLWQRWERGEVTAWEYNMELLDGAEIPEADLEAFLRSVELDPGARELFAWCEANALPFRILSDGFDRNLERLRVLTGVYFEYESNHLRYENGRWRIEPYSPDPSCGCGTGTCKRGRIRDFRERHPGVFVAYIGNGRVSDRCAAHAADLVFAKDTLALALAEDRRPFEAFTTLRDVLPHLRSVLAERCGPGG